MGQLVEEKRRFRIGQIKRQCVKAILKKLTPLFHKSGYRIGPIGESRPLMLVCLKRERKPKGYYSIENIIGFSEEGVMTDAFAGGLVTEGYNALCLEDVIKLRSFVERLELDQFKL